MIKHYRSDSYNWSFEDSNGEFVRWGKTLTDDPEFSPIGPEILDIEISTVCHGSDSSGPCSFCYKANTPTGKYMTYDRFVEVINVFKATGNTNQIALGIGDLDSNPDLEKIIEYTRSIGIIPNITINGYRTTPERLKFLAENCGSIAVSLYSDDSCFNTVKVLTDFGAKQVNIHQVLTKTNNPYCFDLVTKRISTDPRLNKLNALVFLLLKPRGRATESEKFDNIPFLKELIKAAEVRNIKLGFDSCSSPLVLNAMQDHKNFKLIAESIEPCESMLFSCYVNVDGHAFPCSFSEGINDWTTGLNITKDTDFIKDIWFNEKSVTWRTSLINSSKTCKCSLINNCRSCPLFKITTCKEV